MHYQNQDYNQNNTNSNNLYQMPAEFAISESPQLMNFSFRRPLVTFKMLFNI